MATIVQLCLRKGLPVAVENSSSLPCCSRAPLPGPGQSSPQLLTPIVCEAAPLVSRCVGPACSSTLGQERRSIQRMGPHALAEAIASCFQVLTCLHCVLLQVCNVPEHKQVILVRGPASAMQLPCQPMERLKMPWKIPPECSAALPVVPKDSQFLRKTVVPANGGVCSATKDQKSCRCDVNVSLEFHGVLSSLFEKQPRLPILARATWHCHQS